MTMKFKKPKHVGWIIAAIVVVGFIGFSLIPKPMKVEKQMKPHRVVNRATAFAHISEHYAKCKGIYALNPVEMEQSEKCSLHQIGKSKWQSLSGTAHGYTAEYKLLTDWRQYYRIKYCHKGGICDA